MPFRAQDGGGLPGGRPSLAAAPVAAQDGGGSGAAASTVRIQARLLESGKVEFGLQLDGEREWLPQARLFPYATAAVGRWLFASPYTVPTTATPTASQDTPDPSGGTVTDGVYTPNDRTGGVEVWGVVPWDADFLAEYIEMFDFLEACGYWEREWYQCDDPADMEISHQLKTELYQCEVDRNTGACVGFDSVDQEIWDARLACPEGWAIAYGSEVCYHPDHLFYVDPNRPRY